MSEEQQAIWIKSALLQISVIPELIGINYWVNKGGSTALWNDDNMPKAAITVIKEYYNKMVFKDSKT